MRPRSLPGLTRRRLGAFAAAVAAAPGVALAEASDASFLIVAEGGAAADRIEDTGSAFELAISQGCDFLQADLAPTREGSLVAWRSPELSVGSDVAGRPEFASRKTTKDVDGASVEGWFVEDFSLDELKSLMRREARPELKAQNERYEGKEPILSLPEVLAIAREGCVKTGRTIGACLGLVRPAHFAGLGLDVVQRLADELATEGYIAAAAAVWVRAAEPEALRAFGRLSPVRRMQLIEPGSGAPDPAALTAIRDAAEAIAPDPTLLLSYVSQTPTPSALAADARAAGLSVFAGPIFAENAFLPAPLRRGDPGDRGDVRRLMRDLLKLGVDGLATDAPADAARVRRELAPG